MFKKLKYAWQGRDKRWVSVRENHLFFFPRCAACNSDKKLEVHHIIPFSVDKSKELDQSNLITFCNYCHLVIGHLRDYKRWNEFAREDAKNFWTKIEIAKIRNEDYEINWNRPRPKGSNS